MNCCVELTQGVKDTSQRLLDALFLAPSPNSTLRGALVFQSVSKERPSTVQFS